MATGCLGWDTASDVAPSSRTTALPAIRRKNTIDPDMDAEDYATRRSCDGAMRGGEGESDPVPPQGSWTVVYGIRFYAAASNPRRSRRTWAGLR